MAADPNERTVELLQTLIRNACVNDGSPESGYESRNADVVAAVVDRPGVTVQRFEPVPGRASVVATLEGSDPDAQSLCLMGHTDVVPVNAAEWREDPFGGEVIDGEVWGRGAVDMLNLTSSMAIAFADLAAEGFRPRGDLVYFAVADEEAGSAHGARWVAEHHRDAINVDYVLTEYGGVHAPGSGGGPRISVMVGEKGVAWRRLRVRGSPGHGSMPFRIDNALVKAAAVIQRLADYRPAPGFHELWRGQVAAMGLPDELAAALVDERSIDTVLDELPAAAATFLHSCTHTTLSPNLVAGSMKTNVIPDTVDIDVDIRTLPGEGPDEVQAHLEAALGDLAEHVEVTPLMNDRASMSPMDTPLWDALQRSVSVPFPDARLDPQLAVGFTDSRVFRDMGAISYGAGLLSPTIDHAEFGRRFHGHNERIDVESLRLTTDLWRRVVVDLLS